MYRQDNAAPRVLVAACDGRVVGVDPGSGNVLWWHDVGSGTVELVVTDSMVIACTSLKLWCIDYPTGRMVGVAAVSLPYPGRPSVVVEGGWIFVGAGGRVHCYSLQGELVWSRELTMGAARVALGFPHQVRQVDEA